MFSDNEAALARSFTGEDLKALFVYKENTACETHEILRRVDPVSSSTKATAAASTSALSSALVPAKRKREQQGISALGDDYESLFSAAPLLAAAAAGVGHEVARGEDEDSVGQSEADEPDEERAGGAGEGGGGGGGLGRGGAGGLGAGAGTGAGAEEEKLGGDGEQELDPIVSALQTASGDASWVHHASMDGIRDAALQASVARVSFVFSRAVNETPAPRIAQ